MTNAPSEAPRDLERHTTPDGMLTLLVRRVGDHVLVGFEGTAWHTHGDILAELSGLPVPSAVDRFVDDILHGRRAITLLRNDGVLVDAWVSDDPAKDASYAQPGESLELRNWDGTPLCPDRNLER